jgi:peroxin-3
MSFVSSAWEFTKRHKGKMLLLGTAAGGIVYLNRFLSSVERNWEKSASKDFIADVRRKDTHFENSMRTCNSTCNNLVPKIVEILDELLDAQPILDQLSEMKDQKVSAERQIELWNELSVIIFSRAASEVYCTCFFVSYLRLQLLVIAGYIYADSCQESGCSINHNIQLKYVNLLNAFYDEGIREILLPVKQAVRLALKDQSLKKPLTTANLQDIFDQVNITLPYVSTDNRNHLSLSCTVISCIICFVAVPFFPSC